MPDISYYVVDEMSGGEREEFLACYETRKSQEFHNKHVLEEYCQDDVTVLRQACRIFRRESLQIGNIEVFLSNIFLTSNKGDCFHKTDEEMALTGTWVIDEVRLAVQKGYRILEIHELYDYNVTRYDPETREDLFAGYIDTYLKLKAEASGFPASVRTPADEERYIESFWKSEGNQF